MTLMPNKSPEPTAVGAVSSAVAVHVAESAVAQLFSLGQLASVKKKTIIRAVVALVLLLAIGRFVWVLVTSISSVQSAQSPDRHFVARVASEWFTDFWGEASHERHSISVESADGHSVRRIVTDEPWTGWAQDCSIQWATNNSSVTFTFMADELAKTHLIIEVSP